MDSEPARREAVQSGLHLLGHAGEQPGDPVGEVQDDGARRGRREDEVAEPFGRLHDPGRPPLAADMDARIRTFWSDLFKAGGATSVTFEGAIRN
jgi:hypothetical protein